MRQILFSILVTRGTVWQLQMFLPNLRRYWTFLECEMSNSLHNYPRVTRLIRLYGLLYNFGIHSFRTTWLCLIIDVLEILAKFLEPSVDRTVINCAFPFRIANVLHCSVRTSKASVLKLVYVTHWSMQLSNHICCEACMQNRRQNMSVHQLPRYY